MSRPQSPALSASRILLFILIGLNLFTGAMLVFALPASFVFEPFALRLFAAKQAARIDPGWLLPTLRLWILLAVPMVVAAHIGLMRLLAVIGTVREGDPFVPDNAARLKTAAWCALAIQLLGLSYGVLAATMNAAGSRIEWDWSLNGWLYVALMFVVAQVFEEGTRMRDDLEKMI